MATRPPNRFDASQTPIGPYDAPPDAPWFLPDAGDDEPTRAPLPQVQRPKLIDPRSWADAQAALSAELAHLALLYGGLEERLRTGAPGLRHRLALTEAANLSWAVGDRVSADRLGLWQVLRLSGVQDDAPGLARASFALRRLAGGPAPRLDLSEGAALASFLGRQGLPAEVQDLVLLAASLAHLHPATQAAAVAQGWQMLGQGGPTRAVEAGVLASRLAAAMGRAGADGGFVPQTMAGKTLAQGHLAHDRFASWISGATSATRAALLHLDRVSAWQHKASLALADHHGRTPAMLVQVLTGWPMVTSPMAEGVIGANKATILRNFALLQARDLVREVTGQGRYRVWTAKI